MTISEPKQINDGRKGKWMVRVTIDGKLKRKFFRNYESAIQFREEVKETANQVGGNNVILDPDIAADANAAHNLLPKGYTLTQALTEWLAGKGRTDFSGVTYKEALARYWKHLEDRRLAKGTYGGYWHCHENALAKFSTTDTALDISKELEQWFLDLINVRRYSWRTAKRHKAYLDGFYNWAIKERLTTDNWCRFVHFAREPRIEKVFLTPEETESILRAAEKHDQGLIPMLVLSLFAGLRAEEIREGQSGRTVLPWKHIDFQQKTIYVEKAKASAGNIHTQRFVEGLQPNIWEWLEKYGKHGLKLQNWRKRLKIVTDVAGVHKKMNSIFRKSFATYSVPMQGAAITAVQMGHTGPSTTEKHYKGLVPRAEAEKYFAIVP